MFMGLGKEMSQCFWCLYGERAGGQVCGGALLVGQQVAAQHPLCPVLPQVLGPPDPLPVVLQVENG